MTQGEILPPISRTRHEWQEFERTVAGLLTLSGFSVKPEAIVGHKKVDLVASRRDLGRELNYAVECKLYSNRLSLDDLRKIESDYSPLYERGLIDVLLVVTSEPPTAAAATRISLSRFLRHQTISELRFSLIDFRRYLTDIRSSYVAEGLAHYYVPLYATVSSSGADAEELTPVVENWLRASEAPPLALLGSYGSGKSTFLLHLANVCAKRFEAGESGRIPILIPLAEINSEQTVEGLLGRHFTHLHPTPGYSYGLFQELNRLGSFVLLLDGFDEMKHSMTTTVFRYTFREVLKLVVPGAKVILAGRPSAFLTIEEHREFLQATRRVNDRDVVVSDQARFDEIRLAPFTASQIETFIERYGRYLTGAAGEGTAVRIPTRADVFENPQILEMAQRPVQLKMLFMVLPSYEGDLTRFSVLELYTFFVDLLIERESVKESRRRLSNLHRKVFLEGLAFLVWLKGGAGGVGVDDLPDACFEAVATEPEPVESLRRSLISGAFVEVKYPGRLVFPHRSIQEYLIGEFALEYFRGRTEVVKWVRGVGVSPDFAFLDQKASPEILEFMAAASGVGERRAAYDVLKNMHYPIGEKCVEYLVTPESLTWLVEKAIAGEPWALTLLLAGEHRHKWVTGGGRSAGIYKGIAESLWQTELKAYEFQDRLFFGWCLISCEANSEVRKRALQSLILGALHQTHTHQVGFKGKEAAAKLRPAFATEVFSEISTWGGREVSGERLFEVLSVKCQERVGVREWYEGARLRERAFTGRLECTPSMTRLFAEKFDEEKIKAVRRRKA